MTPINLLIKPASGNCNMRCTYCFYSDVMEHRHVRSYGMMSRETLENIIRKTMQIAEGECTIAFQGGEPTLIGLDFYRELAGLLKFYNTRGIKVHNIIQTNGLALNDEWASFFAENDYLVGLSIDGNKAVHDNIRLDRKGQGTYARVAEAAAAMDRINVNYNILTVITAQVARRAQKIYQHYKKNGWRYLQFIPCLDPLNETRGGHEYSLLPEDYETFLKMLFDLWYNDVSRGEFIYIRFFDNLVDMLCGYPPESCGMMGVCSRQYVVEADGSVYPCDFYVTDQYRIGNLNTDNFEAIDKNRESVGFIEQSKAVATECHGCRWYPLCRAGCRRDRDNGRNYYCEAYKGFYPYVIDRLSRLAQRRQII